MLTSNPNLVVGMTAKGQGRVFVYRGEGAGWRSVRSTCASLQRLLPAHFKVQTLSAAELLEGSWVSEASLLVMPGGADLPYCKHLNGNGNTLIKDYVRSGGSYLGLCAGAYYGCCRVEFEPGSPLQVVGDRELNFFPGIARGAAYPGFDYMTESGAVAAHIQFQVPAAFAHNAQQLQQQLEQQQLAASHGQGHQQRQLRQSADSPPGVQLEHSSSNGVWCRTRDYCNGGPMFVTQQGDLDLSGLPGVKVLATYSHIKARTWPTNMTAAAEGQSQHSMQLAQQLGQCSATPGMSSDSGSGRLAQKRRRSRAGSVDESPAAAASQPVAAVRCEVGSGVAVLCGTHPEMEPHWLDVCGRSQEQVTHETEQHTLLASTAVSVAGNGTAMLQQAVAAVGPAAAQRASSPVRPSAGMPVVAMLAGAVIANQQSVGKVKRSIRTHMYDKMYVGESADANSNPADVAQNPILCEDARLQAHTAKLRSTLSAYQQQRDLFLSCLLYEALHRM